MTRPGRSAGITWTSEHAAHLLRRSAFGGTAAEIRRAVDDGCTVTVDRLIRGAIESAASADDADGASIGAIQQWWVRRMLRTEHPLLERMTFFWHNHFATSIVTVKEPALMLGQNRLFRRHALGNFRELATGTARDPAMLLWLDNYLSRKDRPNENFGRELLELFTLGIGNYSEADVMATVRAFTGWTLTSESRDARFKFDADAHDYDPKTVLGRTGGWDGEDVVRIICSTMQHARFLASKLFAWFAYDDPEPEVVDRLARIYLDADARLEPLVRAILTSPEMYSARAFWSRIKSPLDHVVIACRQLRIDAAEPLVSAMNQQGMALFNPPDVAGWKHGMSWINSWSLLTRMKFATLVARTFDPAAVRGDETSGRPSDVVDAYLRILGPLPLDPAVRDRLANAAARRSEREVVRLILSMPEWQFN